MHGVTQVCGLLSVLCIGNYEKCVGHHGLHVRFCSRWHKQVHDLVLNKASGNNNLKKTALLERISIFS